MPAGFEVGDTVHSCTSGTMALYLEAMAAEARSRLGPDHRLTTALDSIVAGLFPGYILSFEEDLVEDRADWAALLALHDAVSPRLLDGGDLGERGRGWWFALAPLVREHLRARLG